MKGKRFLFLIQAKENIARFLKGQVWFQEAQDKWNDLEPSTQFNLQVMGVVGAGALLTILLVWKAISLALIETEHRKKEKWAQELQLLLSENHRMKGMQPQHQEGTQKGKPTQESWQVYFQILAKTMGMEPSDLEISEVPMTAACKRFRERGFAILVKKIHLNQILQYILKLENGWKLARVRKVKIESQKEGVLQLSLWISALDGVE